MTQKERVEKLAEKVHRAYCVWYFKKHNKPYWTKGVYYLLDEETKEADRVTVRAVLDSLTLDEDKIQKVITDSSLMGLIGDEEYKGEVVQLMLDLKAKSSEIIIVKEAK